MVFGQLNFDVLPETSDIDTELSIASCFGQFVREH